MKQQTQALHFGYKKDAERTMAVPIYQTTAYEFESTAFAADTFNLQHGTNNVYTRIGNPTSGVLESRYAALENGSGALVTASGMSAIFYCIVNVAGAGDNIVAASQLYGGTITLFTSTLKRFGIEVRFFDVHNPSAINDLVDSKTKAIFFESITNPSIDVPDFESIVEIGRKHKVLTMVDNTVATPILCQPLNQGCDVVMHSISKYTTGQGLGIGGIIVERKGCGELIADNERYPWFNEPDTTYHGLTYAKDLPEIAFTFRARMALLRDIGAAISPFNSWLFIQGLETLALRMKEHSANALALAEFLKSQELVKKVNYPGLKEDKNYQNAVKYLNNGFSGLLSFEVDSGEKARKIVDNLKLFTIVANIGDSKSIVIHPASTTHRQLNAEELVAAGVPEGLIRISAGIEDREDLINDLKQALAG